MHSPIWIQSKVKLLVLLGITVVAYSSAITRGQSLPWIFAASLLAILVVGYFWPQWVMRNINATRTSPESANQGEVIDFELTLENSGRFHRFLIEIRDYLPFIDGSETQNRSSLRRLGLIAHIGGHKKCSFKVSIPCEKRGMYQLGPLELATSFPLGSIETHQKKSDSVRQLIIYPSVFPIISLPIPGSHSEIHRGNLLLTVDSGSAEFSNLRDYRQGDNPRHIHWLTTVRSNRLMVKQFDPIASAAIHLTLDRSRLANIGIGRHSSFEYAVSIAASIARYACTHNIPFQVTGDQVNESLTMGIGEQYFKGVLEQLALIEADAIVPYSKVLQNAIYHCRSGQTVVVFLSEPDEFATQTMEAMLLLRSYGINLFAILFDRHSFQDKPESETQLLSVWPILLEHGIHYVTIRKNDNLAKVFNL